MFVFAKHQRAIHQAEGISRTTPSMLRSQSECPRASSGSWTLYIYELTTELHLFICIICPCCWSLCSTPAPWISPPLSPFDFVPRVDEWDDALRKETKVRTRRGRLITKPREYWKVESEQWIPGLLSGIIGYGERGITVWLEYGPSYESRLEFKSSSDFMLSSDFKSSSDSMTSSVFLTGYIPDLIYIQLGSRTGWWVD